MLNELNNTIKTLKQGGIILYPTDTVWGLGCDATNFAAVEKLFKLKNREDQKTMICLVSDFNMLNYYIEEIPEAAKMMFGFFPPNSSDNFLNMGAAVLAINLPVSVPPVKEIALICGCSTIAFPVLDPNP